MIRVIVLFQINMNKLKIVKFRVPYHILGIRHTP